MTEISDPSVPLDQPASPPDSNLILARGALFSGLCCFVPLPFLDDYLLQRSNRHIIASLLELHDSTLDVDRMKPVYGNILSCSGILLFLFVLPFKFVFKILIKLIKLLFYVLTIRSAAMQVGHSIILGRTVERCLLDGRIPDQEDADFHTHSRNLRKALDRAYSGSDWRFLGKMLSGVFRSVKGIGSIGRNIARKLYKGQAEPDHPSVEEDMGRLDEKDRGIVDTLSQAIIDIMSQEETLQFLAETDQRFDAAWKELQG